MMRTFDVIADGPCASRASIAASRATIGDSSSDEERP
jgi:hypothetical protein